MKIEIKTNRLDFSLLYFYLLRHYRKYQLEYAGWSAVMLAILLFYPYLKYHHVSAKYSFITSAIAILFPLITEILSRLIDSKNRDYILGIYPSGITTKLPIDQGTLHFQWELVKSITVTHRHIFIFFMDPLALTIPSRAFANEATRDKFIKLAHQYRKAARQKG